MAPADAADVVGAYAYCCLSAAFFAACALAQLNDPDPIPWVAGYVTGGCALNALFVLHHSVGQHFFEADAGVDGRRSMGSICRRIATVFAAGTALVAWRIFAVGLLPRLDLRQPPRALAWSVLEYEEGREIAGLLLLFLHVWKLRGYFCLCGGGGGGGGAANGRAEAGAGARVSTTVLMVSIIAFAVYLWVYYQPMMNVRYGTEHCDGAFGKDRGGVSSPSSEL
jgi:hypothetical protein